MSSRLVELDTDVNPTLGAILVGFAASSMYDERTVEVCVTHGI